MTNIKKPITVDELNAVATDTDETTKLNQDLEKYSDIVNTAIERFNDNAVVAKKKGFRYVTLRLPLNVSSAVYNYILQEVLLSGYKFVNSQVVKDGMANDIFLVF